MAFPCTFKYQPQEPCYCPVEANPGTRKYKWSKQTLHPFITSESSPSCCSKAQCRTLQEQKEELRKRLSYTTHKLEMLETEFDSTRQYLETELRRAQEELEKVREKLRRIQNNYAALERINQDLEDKLHHMAQSHEEEKRAFSHEIIALNNHLMEAKMTIDKLTEDNELYRKDCNLAAQLLQCSKSHYRAHKLSELPADFQERVNDHLEKHGCGFNLPLCRASFSDSVPTCIIAKVLEKPEPTSVPSSHLSSPLTRDVSFVYNNVGSTEKLGRRSPHKSDVYCSDTALYCPEERRKERRQSFDMQFRDVAFLRAQNSTDSATEEEGFQAGFPHEVFHDYVASLQASSSYSSFSAASEEKVNAQGTCLSPTRPSSLYMSGRDNIYERQPSIVSFEHKGSPNFAQPRTLQHVIHSPQNGTPSHYIRTVAASVSEPYHFSRMNTQQVLGSPKLHISEDDLASHWRQLSVEDSSPCTFRNTGRISPRSFVEQHLGPSLVKKMDSRSSPIYGNYKPDHFSEEDEEEETRQRRILESCFVTRASFESDHNSNSKQDKMSPYRTQEAKEQKSERMSAQMYVTSKEKSTGLKKEYVDVSPNSSAESLTQGSVVASDFQQFSLEHDVRASFNAKLQNFQRPGTGLCRKDSLTRAQFYGTLLN
ncbi:brain-enriched guanylate kinase-associated protein isoform X2 [Protopterus annectens]|uniref:brain-enriched guanylate kinase-associated protein isoform X2 n=1 Tax=Protopterus annectens TaxID=7888 RepID=UPI001CFAD189|nr:brain-enriched guanylate kinase-associated protein isoform X2 [Protopterus annectens]